MFDRRALFVVTNTEDVPGLPGPTGFDIREAADVWSAMTDTGIAVDFCSVAGGAVTGVAKGDLTPARRRFVKAFGGRTVIPTVPAHICRAEPYEVLYFVGGIGALWDFPNQPALRALLGDFDAAGKTIGVICHGSAALIGANSSSGVPYLLGRQLTAFTDQEEATRGMLDKIPFSLQQRLIELGAQFSMAPPEESHVIVDNNLVSAQNPTSIPDFAKTLLTQMITASAERATA